MKFSKISAFAAVTSSVFAQDVEIVEDDVWQGPAVGNALARSRKTEATNREEDMEAMASKCFQKHSEQQPEQEKEKFEGSKFFAYGCYCRKKANSGHGKPVDALDQKCQSYKDCQKCVKDKHGDECMDQRRR